MAGIEGTMQNGMKRVRHCQFWLMALPTLCREKKGILVYNIDHPPVGATLEDRLPGAIGTLLFFPLTCALLVSGLYLTCTLLIPQAFLSCPSNELPGDTGLP